MDKDYSSSLKILTNIKKELIGVEEIRGSLIASHNLGKNLIKAGKYEEAIDLLEYAENHFLNIRDEWEACISLLYKGEAWFYKYIRDKKSCDLNNAYDVYRKAANILLKFNDYRFLPKVYDNLFIISIIQGNTKIARTFDRKQDKCRRDRNIFSNSVGLNILEDNARIDNFRNSAHLI